MDNGVLTLASLLASNGGSKLTINKDSVEITILDEQLFITHLSQSILRRMEISMIIKDAEDQKEIKKDYIMLQEKKKIGGKVSFKEEIFSEGNLKMLKNIIEGIREEKKKCVQCGRRYKESVKKLQQGSYPFVTKAKSMGGVRGADEYFSDLCPICYLIGVLQWSDLGLIYRTFSSRTAGKSYLFFPEVNDFKLSQQFKKSYTERVLNVKERYSNIKIPRDGSYSVEYTPGRYSTLLAFYERFADTILMESSLEDFYSKQELAPHTWDVLRIPTGSVKNIRFDRIEIREELLDLLTSMLKNSDHVYSAFIRNVLVFNRNNQINNDITGETKEHLSQAIIEDNFEQFATSFLPTGGNRFFIPKGSREILDKLIVIWRLKPMEFGENELQTIKSVGNIVALVSAKKNVSGLYRIEKARNIAEFWNSLKEVSKRMISFDDEDRRMIKTTSIDDLIEMINRNDKNWKEIRDILTIYACMYYSIKKQKGEMNE